VRIAVSKTSTFFKEFEVNGRCSPANCRAFSLILAALEKHRRVFSVCNWLQQYAGKLVIRGGVSSFLNLGARKSREISVKPWTTPPPSLIKTKVNWQTSFCIYMNSILQKRVGDRRKSSTKMKFMTFSESEWSDLCPVYFTHRIWCWVGNEPGRNDLEKKLSLASRVFRTPSSSDDQEIM